MRQGFARPLVESAMLATLSLMGSLTLPLAVVGHEGSTILVAVNGLRLLLAGRRRPLPAPVCGLQQAARGYQY